MLIVVALGVASAALLARANPQAPPAPARAAAADSTAIVPFKINVPDEVLADLKQRLARARFPDELEGAGWNYGTNTNAPDSATAGALRARITLYESGAPYRDTSRR